MELEETLQALKIRIAQAEAAALRKPGGTALLAVTKGQPASVLQTAWELGLREFGENYWQEAQAKIRALAAYPIAWHFIGPIQSNKASDIARNCSWVHSLDREKIARALNDNRQTSLPPLQVCIQVNLAKETSKSGLDPKDVEALASVILQLPRLQLRGLMLIPPQDYENQDLLALFKQLADLKTQLNNSLNLNLDTLSMGMSDDLETAILAGSTLVRVGRALFGDRPGKPL